MKRIISLVVVVMMALLLFATPAFAATVSLNISPPNVEFSVAADGSTKVEFFVYDFTGKVNISLEDLPLKVEPTTVSVTKKEAGDKVVLTFSGDSSKSGVFDGKIRFLAVTSGMATAGVKVKAKVTVEGKGQPVSEKPAVVALPPKPTSPEPTAPPVPIISVPPVPQVTSEPPLLPPYPPKAEFPIIPIAGIAGGVLVAVILIVTLIRRRRD